MCWAGTELSRTEHAVRVSTDIIGVDRHWIFNFLQLSSKLLQRRSSKYKVVFMIQTQKYRMEQPRKLPVEKGKKDVRRPQPMADPAEPRNLIISIIVFPG